MDSLWNNKTYIPWVQSTHTLCIQRWRGSVYVTTKSHLC